MGTDVASGSIYGPGDTLKFFRHSIRVLPVRGVPWFALPDLCDALECHASGSAVVNRKDFPAWAKMVCGEEPDRDIRGKPQDVTILSPVGVWWWTHLTDALRGQRLAAWAKATALEHCPEARKDDPAIFLQLQPDGSLPPYPCRYSSRRAEWIALKESVGPAARWPRYVA